MTNFLFKVQTFFFAPVNLRAVRIFSILTACLAVYVFQYWEPYPATYSLSGFQLWRHAANTYPYRWMLLLLTTAFVAGFRPRATGLMLVVLLYPLLFEPLRAQSRQILLFSLMCLALLAGGKSSRQLPIWPIRLIQLQLSLVYGVNALAKCSAAYLSGEVLVAMSMTLPNFLIDMSDGFYHCGPLLIPVALAAQASVIIESFLAVGFWFARLRWVAAVVGVVFHFQLKTIIRIGMLDWASMFLYLSFLLKFEARETSSPETAPLP